MPDTARALDRSLLLDLEINGHAVGKIGEFVLRDGALFARSNELNDLGIKVPQGNGDPTALIALSTIAGLSFTVDEPGQVLRVTARDAELLPTVLNPSDTPVIDGTVASGTGAALDYNLTTTLVGGVVVAGGLFDLRAFSSWGGISSGLLTHAGSDGSAPSAIRLDTRYVYADPTSLRVYRVGDVITGGLAWTRPVRLGGVQVARDFGLRPDLVTFPLPSVGGSAAVASTVDVLVNGIKTLSRDVSQGPFQIPKLPVVTGAGTISTTVTNALGQQVVTTLPFYASASLLSPGLQSYSIEVGAVRRSFGSLSNDYRAYAASGVYRRGLSSLLTIETSAQGARGLFNAGAGAVINIANLAIASVAATGSTSAAGFGTRVDLGLQRVGRRFSVGALVTIAGHSFSDIAAVNDDPVPRLQISANASATLRAIGTLGVTYVGIDRDAALPAPLAIVNGGMIVDDRNALQPAQHTHIISGNYSRQFGRLSTYATAYVGLGVGGSRGVLVGIALPLGRRRSAGISAGADQEGPNVQLQVSQSATDIGTWGYQGSATIGKSVRVAGEASYRLPWSLVSADIDHGSGQTSVRAGAQGSLALLGGRIFASNTITDSFGVVETGLPGIRVLFENREVGRTGAGGKLLIPDLRAFDINRLAIEPGDVPLDATLATTTRDVRVGSRSGIRIRFPIEASHAAQVRFVDANGTVIPVGSTARLVPIGGGVATDTVPIGYDGIAYVEHLAAHNEIAVERPDGQRCHASFSYQAVAGEIPTIGPVACVL